MKKTKKITILFLSVILISVITIFLYTLYITPKYNGDISIKSLNTPVDVYFDDYGIPHIYAQNTEDLYIAFGYLHARERLWQMDLLRRIAPGRLSEVFGDKLVDIDKFFKTIGIHQYSVKSVDQLKKRNNKKILMAVESYLKGVNYFIENGYTPIEYTLTGLEKEPFNMIDLYNVIGYMSFSFASAHKVDPWLTEVSNKLKAEYLNDLYLAPDSNTFAIISNPKNTIKYSRITAHAHSVLNNLPVPFWQGSNSWVVGPQKSATGSVLFANDPHISFAQPCVWYEAHLATPENEIYGYFVGGMPFAFLMHNSNLAVGLTMLKNDDTDFYKEQLHSEKNDTYLYQEEWLTFNKRKDTIRVKNSDDIIWETKSTVHGPIINDIIDGLDDNEPIAMWWAYTQNPNLMLEVAYDFNYASNMDEVRKAASNIHAAGLNVMYGDKEGNIAWWASAKFPVRQKNINTKLIIEGANATIYDTYKSFEENPHSENPEQGYVYSANNQTQSPDGHFEPGYYLLEDRAKRIVSLINETEKIDLQKMENMLTDNVSLSSQKAISILLNDLNPESEIENKAISYMENWKGNTDSDEITPTIYQTLIYQVMAKAMKDELGDELFQNFITLPFYKKSILKLLSNQQSIWWDHIHTSEIETRKEIIQKAFHETIESLQNQLGAEIQEWKWSKVHTLEHEHALGAVDFLRPFFNVGPFNVESSTEVINNLSFIMDGDSKYDVILGPSTRRIIDFSDINNSKSILPTGNSGNRFSPHYQDQAKMYNNGEFRPMLINKELISKQKNHLLLTTD